MPKSLLIVPFLLLSAAIGATAAHADQVDYTISGADSGSIAITESGGVISAISGTFDSATINGLLPTGSIGFNDNEYLSPGPFLDFSGVSFSLDGNDPYGNMYVNLFYYSVGGFYVSVQGTCGGSSCGGLSFYPDTITLASAVPDYDPTTGISALALLACAVLIIRVRRPMPTP